MPSFPGRRPGECPDNSRGTALPRGRVHPILPRRAPSGSRPRSRFTCLPQAWPPGGVPAPSPPVRTAPPGVWQPVTGKLAARGSRRARRGSARCAKRPASDVAALVAARGVRATFDPRRDAIRFIVRFAAEIDARAAVRLSREHTAHRFVSCPRGGAARSVGFSARRICRGTAARCCSGGARAPRAGDRVPRRAPRPLRAARSLTLERRSARGQHQLVRRHDRRGLHGGQQRRHAGDQGDHAALRLQGPQGERSSWTRRTTRSRLAAPDEFKLKAMWDVLQSKLVRRQVPLKNLKPGEVEPGGGSSVRQVIEIQDRAHRRSRSRGREGDQGRQAEEGAGGDQGDTVRISSAEQGRAAGRDRAAQGSRISASELKFGNFRSN